jgi:methyl-accepting chemotaxis protein
VNRTASAFSLVEDSSVKVKELVAEIAAASHEQAQGVEQINRSIIEMDKMVQQNAANASESSSTSEQLGEQAGQMTLVVEDLVALVGGTGTGNGNGLHRQSLMVKLREGWRSRRDRKYEESMPLALEEEEHATRLVTHEAAPPPGEGSFKDF